MIVLLAADFFIPLRLLGSLFHVTMNGLAAADKISAVLELPEDEGHAASAPSHFAIRLEDVTFHYPEESAPALQHISLHIGSTGITALAGQSGCGKSTLAALISRAYQPSSGQILLGDKPLSQYGADQLSDMICRIGFDNYLFAGSVAYNLRMAAPEASPEAMISGLKAGCSMGLFKGTARIGYAAYRRRQQFIGRTAAAAGCGPGFVKGRPHLYF